MIPCPPEILMIIVILRQNHGNATISQTGAWPSSFHVEFHPRSASALCSFVQAIQLTFVQATVPCPSCSTIPCPICHQVCCCKTPRRQYPPVGLDDRHQFPCILGETGSFPGHRLQQGTCYTNTSPNKTLLASERLTTSAWPRDGISTYMGCCRINLNHICSALTSEVGEVHVGTTRRP